MARACVVRNLHKILCLIAIAMAYAGNASAMPAPGDADPTDPTVSGNTGAASFQIPIDVPPGPGGLAPKLALVYSSHAGDGPFGVGWRLALGEIRCTTQQRGVPHFPDCDGNSAGSERYELDGQLLVHSAGESGSGEVRYHTLVESFQKIVFTSGTWEVHPPDGTILRYGTRAGSVIQAGGGTARWLLSEIADTYGNLITIDYAASAPDGHSLNGVGADAGMAYPTKISYASDQRTVKFVYEARPDPLQDFAGGVERKISARLTEIQVYSYTNHLVHKRLFGYGGLDGVTYTTGRSRLSWTQLVGSDGATALPREEFRYTDTGLSGNQWSGDQEVWRLEDNPPGFGIPPQIGDVNGDGLPDLVSWPFASVKLNTGSGWVQDPGWTSALAQTGGPMIELNATLVWPDAAKATNGAGQGLPVYPQQSLGVAAATITPGPSDPLPLFPFSQYMNHPNGPPPPAFAYGIEISGLTAATFAWGTVASHPDAQATGGVHAQGLGFQLVDLNADGLADIVVSFSMSGIAVNVQPDGTARDDQVGHDPVGWVPGAQVSVGYRNTGKPCPNGTPGPDCGWVADPDLVRGLPPFASVRVTSIEELIRFESDYSLTSRVAFNRVCSDRLGLVGFAGDGINFGRDMDFCVTYLDYTPHFVDLNGDGYLDLIVIKESSFSAADVATNGVPTVGDVMTPETWAGALGSLSHAWIQHPGEATRWVEAKEFNLPFLHRLLAEDDVGGYCNTASPGDYYAGCPGSRNLDAGVRLVDVNRDGLTDVVWDATNPSLSHPAGAQPTGTGVLINRGSGDPDAAGSAWCSSQDECSWAGVYVPPAPFAVTYGNIVFPEGTFADLNADGWLDMLYFDTTTGQIESWIQSRDGVPLWKQVTRFDPADDPYLATVVPADVNGDGAADLLVTHSTQDHGVKKAFLSGFTADPNATTNAPDLLREVRNGRGGTVKIRYARAAELRSPTLESLAKTDAAIVSYGELANPGPGGLWHLPVVSDVTLESPNRTAGTTTYAYAQPRFASDVRSSFGFRLVERTRPDSSKVQEFYFQKHGRAGRLSQLSVLDSSGTLVLRQWQTWGAPTTTIRGAIPEVFVGRLASVSTVRGRFLNPGPGLPGTLIGPVQVQALSYDDVYGYNFVKQLDDQRATGNVRTVRAPIPVESPTEAAGIYGLVAEERVERPDLPSGDPTLRRSVYTYTDKGRVETRVDDTQRRGETPTTVKTTFAYDGPTGNNTGNLISRTEAADTASARTTVFCYDGDVNGWCPSYPSPDGTQDTRSVLVGIREIDPVGGGFLYTKMEPDSLTGALVEITSDFTDEPAVHLARDVFGRVTEERVKPHGASSFFVRSTTAYTTFTDAVTTDPNRLLIEQRRYDNRLQTSPIRTATLDDGFGGVWKTIEETPSGWVGRLVYHTPATSTVRETYPIACTDDRCSTLTGASGGSATVTTSDILGRPLEVVTPDGTSTVSYDIEDRPPPGSSGTLYFETALFENAKGDRTQRLMDGDRVVWVDECHGTSGCSDADRTYYTYEPSGELAAVHDPLGHQLVYSYDALGRVRQVDDPDGGTSTTTFDLLGRVSEIQNARQQGTADKTFYAHDALDRLTGINQPAPSAVNQDFEITYVAGQRQPWKEQAFTQQHNVIYTNWFSYDDEGRLSQKTHQFPAKTYLLDFAYDELDRTTAITYPDDNPKTIVRYVYQGAYLKQVCEVAALTVNCGDLGATSYIRNVAYDELGRQATVTTPAGTRSYAYTSGTQRLAQDDFHSATPNLYDRTLNYQSYDAVGNLLQVAGSSTGSQVDLSASYSYDDRNRLHSWTKAALGTQYFNYDALGNLTGHGVGAANAANQTFDPSRPHAVTANTDAGRSYAYDPDGNLSAETWSGGGSYFSFDSLNRLHCVGPTTGSCYTFQVDYDLSGARVRETSNNYTPLRDYAGEYFSLDRASNRGDYHIFAFGEEIAYKRKAPITLRTAGTWGPGWDLPVPGPLPVVLLIGLGLAACGIAARRPDWVPGLREHPALGSLTLVLVVAIALPPLPARAGGGGGNVLYRRWILNDPLGSASVVLAADPTQTNGQQQGAVERQVVYRPFGEIYQQPGSQSLDTDVFAGHPREPTTNLHYMNARWQNPTTGGFLSVDPVVAGGDPQSFNGYSYARANPVSLIDPSGMFSTACGQAGGDPIPCPPPPPPPFTITFEPAHIDTSPYSVGTPEVQSLAPPSQRPAGQQGTDLRIDIYPLTVGNHAEAQLINPDPAGPDYRVSGGPEHEEPSFLRQILKAIQTALGGDPFGKVIARSANAPRGIPAGAIPGKSVTVRVPLPFDKAVAEAKHYTDRIMSSNVRYSPTGPNSNTVAFGLSPFLGGPEVTPPASSPGAGPFPFPP